MAITFLFYINIKSFSKKNNKIELFGNFFVWMNLRCYFCLFLPNYH